MMYVPGSSESKVRKAFASGVDSLCFDLEDSVAVDRKVGARETVLLTLNAAEGPSEKLVRINGTTTGLAQDDLEIVLSSPSLDGIVIPKVNSPEDILFVQDMVERHASPDSRDRIRIIASIESARAIINLKEIASCSPKLDALLFAAEDFCADTGIRRTADRRELYHARSAVVLAAKAFSLSAIDLVCIHYQNPQILGEECEEGRNMGFDAKQIIHPAQIATVQRAFSPSDKDIDRAKTILEQYDLAVQEGKGAYGLQGEMMDAPMVLQARRIMEIAKRYHIV